MPTATRVQATAVIIGVLVLLPGCSSTSNTAPEARQTAASGQEAACAALQAKHPDLKGKELFVGSNPGPNNYDHPDPADPSKTAGVEPDLLTAAATCLGFSYTVKQLDFNGLIPALQANNLDLVASGMYASDERAKQVTFVEYMSAFEAAIVQKGNPKSLNSLDSMCGAIAAEVVGTVENAIIDKQSQKCTAAGKAPIKALTFQTDLQALNAVAQGRGDAFLTDSGVVEQYTKKVGNVQRGFAIPSDFVFGIAVNKQKTDLSAALFSTFELFYKDGTTKEAIKRWGFASNQIVKPLLKG